VASIFYPSIGKCSSIIVKGCFFLGGLLLRVRGGTIGSSLLAAVALWLETIFSNNCFNVIFGTHICAAEESGSADAAGSVWVLFTGRSLPRNLPCGLIIIINVEMNVLRMRNDEKMKMTL